MLEPFGKRIIVEPIEMESTTPGGIVIPDVAKDAPVLGKVLAVGAELEDGTAGKPEVGDTILFSKYGGHEIKYDSQSLKILLMDEVLARVSGAKKPTVRRK